MTVRVPEWAYKVLEGMQRRDDVAPSTRAAELIQDLCAKEVHAAKLILAAKDIEQVNETTGK